MSGVNKVILVGHLGKDPNIRQLKDNVTVANFPFATTEIISKNGKRIESTEWHNVIMWRTLAEIAGKILRKGNLVYLEGKARTRSFTDNSGINKYTTEIVVEEFTLLSPQNINHEQSNT